jgi:hypothetical protein
MDVDTHSPTPEAADEDSDAKELARLEHVVLKISEYQELPGECVSECMPVSERGCEFVYVPCVCGLHTYTHNFTYLLTHSTRVELGWCGMGSSQVEHWTRAGRRGGVPNARRVCMCVCVCVPEVYRMHLILLVVVRLYINHHTLSLSFSLSDVLQVFSPALAPYSRGRDRRCVCGENIQCV